MLEVCEVKQHKDLWITDGQGILDWVEVDKRVDKQVCEQEYWSSMDKLTTSTGVEQWGECIKRYLHPES